VHIQVKNFALHFQSENGTAVCIHITQHLYNQNKWNLFVD